MVKKAAEKAPKKQKATRPRKPKAKPAASVEDDDINDELRDIAENDPELVEVATMPLDRFTIAQPSGYAKMKALGKKAIQLTVTEEQYDKLKSAAEKDFRKLASWILFVAMQRAEQ